jgi:Asp-tRNA(Asn)/Glu-tRNA(Gln) amidotransferase A subunit family amidase
VPDAAAFAAVLAGWPAGPIAKPDRAPRLGFCRSPVWSEVEPATVEAMDEAVARARRAGATVVEIDLPRPFDDMMAAQRVITATETWRSLAYERESHDGLLSDSIKAYLAPGATQDMERYHWALGVQTACRAAMQDVLGGLDSLMTPAAPGEAPEGLTDTGAAVFNQIWTAAGVPSVTVPGLIGPRGLPVGVQLVGPFRGDTRVLSSAAWMHGILGRALRGE